MAQHRRSPAAARGDQRRRDARAAGGAGGADRRPSCAPRLRKVHARKDLVIEVDVARRCGLRRRSRRPHRAARQPDRQRLQVVPRQGARPGAAATRHGPPRSSLSIRVEDDGAGHRAGRSARVLERGVRADERAPRPRPGPGHGGRHGGAVRRRAGRSANRPACTAPALSVALARAAARRPGVITSPA